MSGLPAATPNVVPASSRPYIPTGYETQSAEVQRRRALAQALMQAGLQSGPKRSYAEVFGQIAQAWAGKRLQKKADASEVEINASRQKDYQAANSDFEADAREMTPEQLVMKYGSNPLLKDRLKPYEGAFEKRLVPDIANVNGVWVDRNKQTPGSYAPADPSASVLRDGQGNFIPNAAAIASALRRQGFSDVPTGAFADPTRAIPNPTADLTSTPGFDKLGNEEQALVLKHWPSATPDQKAIVLRGLANLNGIPMGSPVDVRSDGSAGGGPISRSIPNGLSPEQVNAANRPQTTVIDGKIYYIINGELHDSFGDR